MKSPQTLRLWRCSHSSLATFITCRKKYYLGNWWYLPGSSLALSVGSIAHLALQGYYEGEGLEKIWQKVDHEIDKCEDFEFKERLENTLYPLLEGYFAYYRHDPLNMQACEFKFTLDFGEGLPVYKGRCDGFGKADGYWWIVEHKTASGTPEALFRNFDNDRQILGYFLAGLAKYKEYTPKGILVNALFKKTTRSMGGYGRRYVIPLPWDLKRWWEETREIIRTLVEADSRGPQAFYRNPSACLDYGQRCIFWDYCSVGSDDMLALHYLPQTGLRDSMRNDKEGEVFTISKEEAEDEISTSEA